MSLEEKSDPALANVLKKVRRNSDNVLRRHHRLAVQGMILHTQPITFQVPEPGGDDFIAHLKSVAPSGFVSVRKGQHNSRQLTIKLREDDAVAMNETLNIVDYHSAGRWWRRISMVRQNYHDAVVTAGIVRRLPSLLLLTRAGMCTHRTCYHRPQ
jgi:hypothetical protein